MSFFKGLWDDWDRRNGEVTLCDFLPRPISSGLTSTCTHSLSICINQTIHEPRHTCAMTHTLLSVQGRRWTKVTLLQFGRRTVNESACSASHTALSALSIRLPVYRPTFRISLWLYLVYLTCLASTGLYFTFLSFLSTFSWFRCQYGSNTVLFRSSNVGNLLLLAKVLKRQYDKHGNITLHQMSGGEKVRIT